MATSATATPFPTAESGPLGDPKVAALDEPLQPATATADGDGTADKMAAQRNELLDRVVQSAHEAIDRLAEQAGPQLQRLQDGVSSTGEMLSRQADNVRETGDEWAENVRGTVREHPLAAVVTAVALGVLLARLTS